MVCNTENSIYQIPIVGSSGMTEGLFRLSESAAEMAPNDRILRRIWRGLPDARHVEKLVLTKGFDRTREFGLLIEAPEGHWMRDMSHRKAASWLTDNAYDLPDQLRDLSPTAIDLRDRSPRAQEARKPLTPDLFTIYDLLDDTAMPMEAILVALDLGYPDDASGRKRGAAMVRKRIDRVNKNPDFEIAHRHDVGYYRPDAPPPELSVT